MYNLTTFEFLHSSFLFDMQVFYSTFDMVAREDYLHLYRTVMQTVASLERIVDPSEIDAILIMLDCLKRLFVNKTDTDAVVH